MDINHQLLAKRWWRALPDSGPELPKDHGKPLRDGIWELRVIVHRHQHRFLYFFHGDFVVITNAFLKKTWEVPEIEIERSRKAGLEWLSRRGWEYL